MTELFAGRSPETIDLLLRRRSSSAKAMREPGPSQEEITLILRAGIRVPDHGKLAPWRFILFQGPARAEFGKALAERLLELEPDAGEIRADIERSRFLRAPLVIGVVSGHKPGKIPEWEQRLSAAAVCQNMVIATVALGYGAQWVTEWYAYDTAIDSALGLSPDEKMAGFIYVGTSAEPLSERERPSLEKLVTNWQHPVSKAR